MGPNIMQSINEVERVGKEQADQFTKERLVTKSKDTDALIKKASNHSFHLDMQSCLKTLLLIFFKTNIKDAALT